MRIKGEMARNHIERPLKPTAPLLFGSKLGGCPLILTPNNTLGLQRAHGYKKCWAWSLAEAARTQASTTTNYDVGSTA